MKNIRPSEAGIYWGKWDRPNQNIRYHLIIVVDGNPPWLEVSSIFNIHNDTIEYRLSTPSRAPFSDIVWGPKIEKP